MPKKKFLIIVESPSKCTKIEKYLNESFKEYIFKCVASVGHIKNLPYKKLSVDVKNNYEADFQIIDDEWNLICLGKNYFLCHVIDVVEFNTDDVSDF